MRGWQLLLAAGLVGVGSLLLVPMELFVSSPMPPATLRVLALVNPAFLLVLAVGIGEATARRVGLGAPVIDARLSGKDARTVLRRQLLPALIVGVVVAMIVVIYGMTIGRNLIAIAGPQSRLASFDLPLVPKLLYGGITEEIITRWGLVSLIAWIGWRLKGRPATLPGSLLVIAVATAALLFGAGHLPLLFLIVPHATAGLVVAVLAANVVPGILFGALYVRQGLEAAMIAHATAHLIAAIAIASFRG